MTNLTSNLQSACEICGKPATQWAMRDPFGKSDATRPLCGDHGISIRNPADIAEIERYQVALLEIRKALGLHRDSNDSLVSVALKLRLTNERLGAALIIAQRYVQEREFPVDHPVRSAVDHALSGDSSTPVQSQFEIMRSMLEGLADAVLDTMRAHPDTLECCSVTKSRAEKAQQYLSANSSSVETTASTVPLSVYESAVRTRSDMRQAYKQARSLLRQFVAAWEGQPGHENMDRLCEIARNLGSESAEETSSDGWKCVTCGHENPKDVLRCQNSKCTVLSYSSEHSAKEGLASAGSSAAVNPPDTVGRSAEPSGRPVEKEETFRQGIDRVRRELQEIKQPVPDETLDRNKPELYPSYCKFCGFVTPCGCPAGSVVNGEGESCA